jgi:hypothetical protein
MDPLSTVRRYDWGKLFFELIVVFLGVTAGFLLNNWQLEQKDKEIESQLIIAFQQDLALDMAELTSSIEDDLAWLTLMQPTLLALRDKTLPIDSASVVAQRVVQVNKISLQTGTYEAVINSGTLNLITDFELKRKIVDYYVGIEETKFVDDFFFTYVSDFVMPFVLTEMNMLTAEINDPQMTQTTQFANIISGYFSLVQQRRDAYQELLDQGIELSRFLESGHGSSE